MCPQKKAIEILNVFKERLKLKKKNIFPSGAKWKQLQQTLTYENETNDATTPIMYDEYVDIVPLYNQYLINLQVYVDFNILSNQQSRMTYHIIRDIYNNSKCLVQVFSGKKYFQIRDFNMLLSFTTREMTQALKSLAREESDI